ncbi:DUF2934 domain-containing protein [Hydrogenophaga sp.]|uniref:DUF2934 domain-containing protein n=1 Tax=Hydrogenophaga sp. TaxID=1904254 RepID=UPI00260D4A18|nr:DUF2934 domain-containing protein [Hydrogenophaga sp.]MDM7949644.1 DUF2934 domain-containing protein [Hydrogenophaga sp.]
MPRSSSTTKPSTLAAKAMSTASPLTSTARAKAAQKPASIDHQTAVREAAYARFEARGCEPGHELDDWLQAETLVRQATGGSKKKAH